MGLAGFRDQFPPLGYLPNWRRGTDSNRRGFVGLGALAVRWTPYSSFPLRMVLVSRVERESVAYKATALTAKLDEGMEARP